jgi:hypothetical protein
MANFTINSNTYDGLKPEIKDSLWHVAVLNAPYRTGNLRSSIKRVSMSNNKVIFLYSEAQAFYTKFLEQGLGRNKKHIGFIENLTVGSMVFEIAKYIQTNNPSFSGIPLVQLRTDKQRNYERKIMKSMGFTSGVRVNAVDRAQLSWMAFKGKRKSNKTGLEKYGDKIKSVATENLGMQIIKRKFQSSSTKGIGGGGS